MRVEQKPGRRGSQKWMQAAVSKSAIMDHALRSALGLPPDAHVDWRSPRQDDGWAEYRDGGFLEALGFSKLYTALRGFWPSRGPQWDGLARVSTGEVILIEAKSHPAEMASSCAASPDSRARIEKAFGAAKEALGADPAADWTTPYYQYGNRLAHLHFLRSAGVPAHLVFVYFLNDSEMRGPTSRDEWLPMIAEVHSVLGLRAGLPPGVHDIFLDVGLLSA